MLRGTYFPRLYSEQSLLVLFLKQKVIQGTEFSKIYYTAQYEPIFTALA